MFGEKGARRGLLTVTEFDHETGLGLELRCGFAGQSSQEAEAIRTAIEGQARVVVFDLGLELIDLGGRDVGWIGDDQIEAQIGRQRCEAIAAVKSDAMFGLVAGGVFAGYDQGVGRQIDGVDMGMGKGMGEGDGEAPAAGSEIEENERLGCAGLESGQGEFGELFGFGPGNENASIHFELEAVEGGGAEDMLQRFASTAALDQDSQGIEIGIGDGTIELEVELQSGDAELVCEEPFDLESGRFDAFAGEELRAALDDFKHCHGHVTRPKG
jgi:hypothetical protein